MATTARMSAARSRTVEAVAAATGTRVRRATLTTLSGSPRRSGRRWLPASDTCRAESDWPKLSPGSARHQSPARSAKASAYAPRATVRPRGSRAAASAVSARVSRSTEWTT